MPAKREACCCQPCSHWFISAGRSQQAACAYNYSTDISREQQAMPPQPARRGVLSCHATSTAHDSNKVSSLPAPCPSPWRKPAADARHPGRPRFSCTISSPTRMRQAAVRCLPSSDRRRNFLEISPRIALFPRIESMAKRHARTQREKEPAIGNIHQTHPKFFRSRASRGPAYRPAISSR